MNVKSALATIGRAQPFRIASSKQDPLTDTPVQVVPRVSIPIVGDFRASYETLYRSQPWVYTVVNKLTRAIARLPLHVYALNEETGDRAVLREHALARTLRSPWTGGSSFRLKEWIVGSTAVYGHALFVVRRDGSEVREVWPVPWSRVTVEYSGVQPSLYRIATGGQELRFAPEDVLHFSFWGPEPMSCSPLEPLRRMLATEDAAQRSELATFRNGLRPPGGLKTPKVLRDDQKQELRAEIERVYTGVDNNGRPFILDGGLDWVPFGGSPADSQLLEARKLNREEACAVYDIPPPMVHILDRATFSNIDEQHRMLYQDTLGPWLAMIEETMDAQLLGSEEDVFVEFKLDEVLRGDVEKRSAAYQRFIHAATYTPNEIRKLENLPRIEHPLADAIYVPLNAQPAGADLPEETEQQVQARALSLLMDELVERARKESP
jgi:HK97 family phage portal protein